MPEHEQGLSVLRRRLERLPFSLMRKVISARNLILRRGIHFGTNGRPFPLLTEFKSAMQATPQPEVLAFGDSVFQRVAHQDDHRQNLGELLAARLTKLGLPSHVLSHSSYTPYLYEAFLRLADRLGAKPRYVILPFNIRCLSPQWEGSPIWQFTQDHAAVEAQILAPSAPVAALEPVWEDLGVYHATAFASPLTSRRTVGEFRALARENPQEAAAIEQRRRELLIFHYGMPVREAHRNLIYLGAAVRASLALGAKPLVYLTPINMGLIRKIGGPALVDIVTANARLVRDAALGADAGAGQILWGDWLDALPSSGFFHENELTEHLCVAGRERLADLIIDEIAKDSSALGPDRDRAGKLRRKIFPPPPDVKVSGA